MMYEYLILKRNVEKRGVDDPTLLPKYYYRDDGILIWNAIEAYVTEIIDIFYKTDDDVKEDTEVQSWANDVHFNAFPGHDGAPDGHGFPEKMESRQELIHYCTLIMFTGSAQHAAVNFGQFDIYGFAPNSPFTLRKPPPAKKGVTTFADILESLPTLFNSGLSSGLVFSLVQFSPDEVSIRLLKLLYYSSYGSYTRLIINHYLQIFLGGYPNYWTMEEAQATSRKFVDKMKKLDDQLKKRNETMDMPYKYLLPSRIPNSITI